MLSGQTPTPIVPEGDVFPRIVWMRDVEKDPRVTGGPLDLARVMGIGADRYGSCDLTIGQIQERLVLRQQDGKYIPERTIKSWRTKLKRLGLVRDVAPAVAAGFAGPGKGRGGRWQLLVNGQSEPLKTGNETGNGVARSTSSTRATSSLSSSPTSSSSPHPQGGEVVEPVSSIGEGAVAKATPPLPTQGVDHYPVAPSAERDDLPSGLHGDAVLPWSTSAPWTPSDRPPNLRWLQEVIGNDHYVPTYRIQAFRDLTSEWDEIDALSAEPPR